MNIYQSIGVTPIINALGTFTRVGGSLMPAEVLQSMQAAAESFVCMEELQYAAGKFIAARTGAEAAYVTSGAQAALVLSVAACITGLDAAKMDRLPETAGLRNQVVMARIHRNHYDHSVEAAGGSIVEAGGDTTCLPEDLATCFNDLTSAVLYLPGDEDRLALADVVDVAHRRGVPVIVDAAGRCDEPRNLTGYVAAGADIVCFSGGKIHTWSSGIGIRLRPAGTDLGDRLAAPGYGFHAERMDRPARTPLCWRTGVHSATRDRPRL